MTEWHYALYGDGVHDDTDAIQERLDSRIACVYLPAPKKHYCISRTLKIHSNQTLRLDSTTEIRLMPKCDFCMITNADPRGEDQHITVEGGIWNMDNMNQTPFMAHLKVLPGDQYPRNYAPGFPPLSDKWNNAANQDGKYDLPEECRYMSAEGSICTMVFSHIKYFTLRNLTIKNPRYFATYMFYLQYFTIENITFDFNYGNPYAIHMDGIHLDGGCRFGHIRNLQGRCFDDLLALNADDSIYGPIEDISVDGLYSDNCHSAVRMLSTKSWIRNINIQNVYGTYWQYAVGITRFHYRPDEVNSLGLYDNIMLKNICVSKAPRYSLYCKDDSYVYPLIFIERLLHIGRLHIENLHRLEKVTPIDTIYVGEKTDISEMVITDSSQENRLAEPFPFLRSEGMIEKLIISNTDSGKDDLLAGNMPKLLFSR